MTPSPARPREVAKVLVIDNYDSFTFNLAQYVRARGHRVTVVRNDVLGPARIEERFRAGELTHLLISPGPGHPASAGVSAELVLRLGSSVPTLGVCLGHQVIGWCHGAAIGPAPTLVHGKASLLRHDARGVYAGLPTPLVVGRYHSLAVTDQDLPPDLEVTSRSPNGTIMGLRHRRHPVEGIQWHPESVMSGEARRVIDNFLEGDSHRS